MSEREILFRGKRADNAEWIEGYYMYHINRTICPAGDSIKPEDVEHIILFDGFSDCNMPRGINYKHVLPETVCQYTGLTDKNGRKIFEGDIVQEYPFKAIVKFGEFENQVLKNIGFNLDWLNVVSYRQDLPYWVNEIEVIGNIFDNQELLN